MVREIRRRRKRKSSQVGWIIAFVGGLSGLAGLGIVLTLTLRGGQEDAVASEKGSSASNAQEEVPAGWKKISVPGYGVEVLMPDSPQYRVRPNVEDGQKSYFSKNNNGRIFYQLECKCLGGMTPQRRQAELSKWAADSLRGWPTVHGRWEISLGEAPGIAIQTSEEGSKMKKRCFVVGDRMISQMVFVKSGDFDTLSTRRFLDSLRIDGLSVTHTAEYYSNSAK